MQIAEYTRAPEYRRMPTDTKPKARTRAVERRKALGMTQNTLSARSGVPQPTISRFEAGDEVLPDTVRAIVAALGTTAAWINGETDDSSPVAEPLPAQHMLSEAIGRAFDARRHSTADIRAVEDTLSSLVGLTDALSDLDAAARVARRSGVSATETAPSDGNGAPRQSNGGADPPTPRPQRRG